MPFYDLISTGGSSIAVLDEGVLIASGISSLDFVGSGVSVSAIGSAVTVSISGGGGSGGSTAVESIAFNGTTTVFTLTNTPVYIVSDGQTMINGYGYTLSGLQVTFDVAPKTEAFSIYNTVSGSPVIATEIIAADGVTTVFNLTHVPISISVLGQSMISGYGYTLSGLQVTFDVAPPTNQAWSIYNTSGSSGGSGYTIETPTGTVDGSNVTFTVTVIPVFIISDGVTYFANQGYTIAGLTLTLSVAPTNFIRNFHV